MNNCFVYGTLKNGFPNNNILKGIKFDKGYIVDYEMYGKTYFFPFVKKGKGVVHGEIYYNVPKRIMKELDILEGHPNFYKREVALITTSDGMSQPAWVYLNPLGAKDVGGKISSGNWTKTKMI